jgi:hypothetical protein
MPSRPKLDAKVGSVDSWSPNASTTSQKNVIGSIMGIKSTTTDAEKRKGAMVQEEHIEINVKPTTWDEIRRQAKGRST